MSDQQPIPEPQSGQVKEFTPRTLESSGIKIKNFVPNQLKGQVVKEYKQVQKDFGSFAKTDPGTNKHFALHPDSKLALGVDAEEKSQLEGAIQAEVDSRVDQFRDQGYQEGLKRGTAEGIKVATEKLDAEIRPHFDRFTALLQGFDDAKKMIHAANEQVLLQMIFTIARQVLLRELKTDPEYLKRLLALVIDRIGVKDHIRVRVGTQDQASIDPLRDFLKAQYPDLRNIQIETTEDVVEGGCQVETDLIRVNASIETQLKAIQDTLAKGN